MESLMAGDTSAVCQDEDMLNVIKKSAIVYTSHTSNQPPPATSLCLKKSSKAPDFWLLIQLTLLITYHQHKWKMISDTEGISKELDLE